MKKNFTFQILNFIVLCLFVFNLVQAQTINLAYFSFTDNAIQPNTPTSYLAEAGEQVDVAGLYLDGTNGSSAWSSTELNAYTGSAINVLSGFDAGKDLSMIGSSANGKSIVFKLSTNDYQNLAMTFAGRRSGTGFNSTVWAYSTDATNFTTLEGISTIPSAAGTYQLMSIDFSSYTALNDQATVYIKCTFDGATSENGSYRIDNVQFNAVSAGQGESAVAPTFSPSGGIQYGPITVTISSATPNAAIHYTTDGSTPDSTSTLYTTPIPINQTTTLKAIACAQGLSASYVTTETYTFPLEVADIAALKAGGVVNTPYKINGDLTFVFNNNIYTYLQDSTGGLLIYDNGNIITSDYSEGDIISGGLFGTYKIFHGQIELEPLINPATSTTNVGSLAPTTVTIADLTANYSSYDAKLIHLQNVTLSQSLTHTAGTQGTNDTITQNGNSIIIYNRFKTLDTTMAAGTVTDITGFAAIFDNHVQIYPRSNADLVPTVVTPTVADPVITPISGTYADSVTFNIVCATEEATIRYTTDGTVPTETSTIYTAPVTLYATTTICAKAFKTGWIASNAFYAYYTIVHEASLSVTPTALTFNSTELSKDFTVSCAYLTEPVVLTCNNMHFMLSENTISGTSGNTVVTVTFDGIEPANGIITISSGTLTAQVTLTAIATLPAPVFTPADGATDTALTITIADAVADAEIRYTLDGSMPTSNSTLYVTPIVLNMSGTYTFKAIAFKNGWDNSEPSTATYIIVPPSPVYHDTLTYYTGFEAEEGFTSTTVYNNPAEAYSGDGATQWATVFGTPSTTSPIDGEQSMQMRWYTSSAAILGYTRTNFDIQHVTRVQFKAKSTNNLKVAVSYSTDGGNNYVAPTIYELGSDADFYNYTVSDSGQYDNVRLKFAIVLPDEQPTSTSRLYIDSVCVFAIPGLVSNTVDAPVISPNSGTYYDTVQVSITSATQDAQIYYTLDGTIPTEESSLYTVPFNLTSTTIVKAKAFKFGYIPSNVSTGNFNFPVEVPNIAAFKAANSATNSTVYKITGDITFVYRHGSNIYVQDSSGSLLIYDNANIITSDYYEGDIISGGLCGTYTLYNGLVEMVPTVNTAVSVTNIGAITPEIVTIEGIEEHYNAYESKLVTIADVIFTEGGTYTTTQASNMTIGQNGETMQCRNVHKTLDMTIPAGYNANVTGFILQYNDNYQIAPRDNNDIVGIVPDTVAKPIITINTTLDNNINFAIIHITCATEGADIYYTLDGTEPTTNSTLYTDTFTLMSGQWTIKAFAVKEGMIDSPVATEQIFVGDNEVPDFDYDRMISAYPNPTTGKITILYDDLDIRRIELYTITGQLLRSQSAEPAHTSLSLENEADGLYFVKLIGNNFTAIQKISKQ